jgi:hypothetical protein
MRREKKSLSLPSRFTGAKRTSVPKEIAVAVDAPASGYRSSIYANRFFLGRVDDYLLIHFGSVGNRLTLAEVAVLMAVEDLVRNREGNMAYLDALKKEGESANEYEEWRPASNRADVSVINVLSLTRSGKIAESLLLNISGRHVWEKTQHTSGNRISIDAEPIALIRSTTSFQMTLLFEIYKAIA